MRGDIDYDEPNSEDPFEMQGLSATQTPVVAQDASPALVRCVDDFLTTKLKKKPKLARKLRTVWDFEKQLPDFLTKSAPVQGAVVCKLFVSELKRSKKKSPEIELFLQNFQQAFHDKLGERTALEIELQFQKQKAIYCFRGCLAEEGAKKDSPLGRVLYPLEELVKNLETQLSNVPGTLFETLVTDFFSNAEAVFKANKSQDKFEAFKTTVSEKLRPLQEARAELTKKLALSVDAKPADVEAEVETTSEPKFEVNPQTQSMIVWLKDYLVEKKKAAQGDNNLTAVLNKLEVELGLEEHLALDPEILIAEFLVSVKEKVMDANVGSPNPIDYLRAFVPPIRERARQMLNNDGLYLSLRIHEVFSTFLNIGRFNINSAKVGEQKIEAPAEMMAQFEAFKTQCSEKNYRTYKKFEAAAQVFAKKCGPELLSAWNTHIMGPAKRAYDEVQKPEVDVKEETTVSPSKSSVLDLLRAVKDSAVDVTSGVVEDIKKEAKDLVPSFPAANKKYTVGGKFGAKVKDLLSRDKASVEAVSPVVVDDPTPVISIPVTSTATSSTAFFTQPKSPSKQESLLDKLDAGFDALVTPLEDTAQNVVDALRGRKNSDPNQFIDGVGGTVKQMTPPTTPSPTRVSGESSPKTPHKSEEEIAREKEAADKKAAELKEFLIRVREKANKQIEKIQETADKQKENVSQFVSALNTVMDKKVAEVTASVAEFRADYRRVSSSFSYLKMSELEQTNFVKKQSDIEKAKRNLKTEVTSVKDSLTQEKEREILSRIQAKADEAKIAIELSVTEAVKALENNFTPENIQRTEQTVEQEIFELRVSAVKSVENVGSTESEALDKSVADVDAKKQQDHTCTYDFLRSVEYLNYQAKIRKEITEQQAVEEKMGETEKKKQGFLNIRGTLNREFDSLMTSHFFPVNETALEGKRETLSASHRFSLRKGNLAKVVAELEHPTDPQEAADVRVNKIVSSWGERFLKAILIPKLGGNRYAAWLQKRDLALQEFVASYELARTFKVNRDVRTTVDAIEQFAQANHVAQPHVMRAKGYIERIHANTAKIAASVAEIGELEAEISLRQQRVQRAQGEMQEFEARCASNQKYKEMAKELYPAAFHVQAPVVVEARRAASPAPGVVDL